MWLFPILIICVYGPAFAILGAVVIACLPGWRVTWAHLIWLAVGGFPGAAAAARVATWGVTKLPATWSVHSRDAGNVLGFSIVLIGAALGGSAFVWIKMRIVERRSGMSRV